MYRTGRRLFVKPEESSRDDSEALLRPLEGATILTGAAGLFCSRLSRRRICLAPQNEVSIMGDGHLPGTEPRRESGGTGVRLRKLRLPVGVGLTGRDRGSVAYLKGVDWMQRSDPPMLLGCGLGPRGARASSSGTFILLGPQKDVSTNVR